MSKIEKIAVIALCYAFALPLAGVDLLPKFAGAMLAGAYDDNGANREQIEQYDREVEAAFHRDVALLLIIGAGGTLWIVRTPKAKPPELANLRGSGVNDC